MKKKLYLSLLIMILTGCSNVKSSNNTESSIKENVNPIICINLSNNKTIRCELYPDIAPITVNNFLTLIDNDYYDGTIFHRVIENFMIQCGGYTIVESTIYPMESVSTIVGEFSNNGYENNLAHTPGVLSMARSNDYNSASSQFFICVATYPSLDGNYAAFGKVIDEESLDNAVEISKVTTTIVYPYFQNFPVEPISIISIERLN